MDTTPIDTGAPRLQLGLVVATRAVADEVMTHPEGVAFAHQCLARHQRGDWGEALDPHDTAVNAEALTTGARVMSVYPIPANVTDTGQLREHTLWIITEAADDTGHRHATTLLYPSDY